MNSIKIVFILFIFFPSFALAEKKVRSLGHLSCGKFLSYCDESKLQINCQAQTAFVQGYISAISWELDIPVKRFPQDNIKYALIKFCSDNPLNDTQDGAINILKQLK